MRLLVCGGRDFSDTAYAYATLDRLHKTYGIGVVIEGDARGADRIAGYWARRKGIDNLKFPADWKTHGLGAGPIRNAKMLAEGKPDMVLAFPGGRGTADMVRRARAAGILIQHEIRTQAIEARQGGDGTAPSQSDESAVGETDAPNPLRSKDETNV
jgi:hypothetical protein